MRVALRRAKRLHFADKCERDLSPMRGAAVFEQENTLPRAKLHFAVNNRHGFAGTRQDHANVRWHVITAFGAMCEVIGIFRDQAFEERFQITSRSRIGIFHGDHAAARVLDKNGRRSVFHTALVDL